MNATEIQLVILLVAFFSDWIFADPLWLYHPVQAIGFLTVHSENFFRSVFKNNLKLAGIFFLIFQLFFWIAVVFIIFNLFYKINYIFGLLFLIYITYALLAFGSLIREVKKVKKYIENNNMNRAREVAQGMVSRDLSKEVLSGIVRATIETATENISDGIIAPLFYFFIGGPIAMVFYKVVNTLDSMVGYKNEKYIKFGWAIAKFDDLLNLIPARITGCLIVLTSFIFGDDYKNSWKIWMQDGQKGPSPNGGIPITAFAGARDITLGGPCYVGGQIIDIPFVGGKKKQFGVEEIGVVLKYIYTVSLIMVFLIVFIISY